MNNLNGSPMKYILYLILLFASTIYSQDTQTISIAKNNQGGYNFIRDGEIIYEYTKQNFDSASLATLAEIYSESTKEGKGSTGVNIINLPPASGTDLWSIILPVITILASYFIVRYTNSLNSKAQTDNYNRQIRAENKRQYIQQLRVDGAKIITGLFRFEKLKDNDIITEDFSDLLWSFYLLLTAEHTHIRKFISECMHRGDKTLSIKIISEVNLLKEIDKVIKDEQDKLDRGEF